MYGAGRDGLPLTRFEREMAASLSEFEHGLSLGAPGGWHSPEAGLYRIRHEGVQLEIRVSALGDRRIGALTLPRLSLVYEFTTGTAEQRRHLLARLDLAMQRGGG